MPVPVWYNEEAVAGRWVLDPAHDWPESHEDSSYDPSWHIRERSRFFHDDGKGEIYRSLPDAWVALPFIPGHFVHYSIKHPGMIAYTASYQHGESDRQTVMKPGRYLGKYYPNLPQPEIARLASMVSALAKPSEIQWARTRDEIANVYLNGPNSCMSHSTSSYDSCGVHPTEVYATPDIGLAYLYGDDDRIVARTIVRFRDDKPTSWIRIYGDELRMESALSALGVEQDRCALGGARLLLIDADDDGYVCPYLDGNCNYVTPSGNYLRIGRDGDHSAATTNGIVEVENRPTCDSCGDHCDEDELESVDDDGEMYCRACIRRNYTWSDYEDRWINDDDVITAYREDRRGRREEVTISRHSREDGDWINCELSGNIIHQDLAVELVRRDDERDDAVWVDPQEIDDECYKECGEEGIYFHVDDMIQSGSSWYWKRSLTGSELYEESAGVQPCGRIDDPRQLELESVI